MTTARRLTANGGPEFVIRLATPDDAPVLRGNLSTMRLSDRERALGALAWVAWAGTIPLGGITTVTGTEDGRIDPAGVIGVIPTLWVEPPWRRRGIARALLAHAIADLRARGLRRVTLHTNSDSTEARALYESTGWVQTEAYSNVIGYALDLI